jgi:hypothetical protein
MFQDVAGSAVNGRAKNGSGFGQDRHGNMVSATPSGGFSHRL